MFPKVPKATFLLEHVMMFSTTSFKEAVGTSLAFSLRLNDQRRRTRPMFQNTAGILTGCDFKSEMMKTGQRVPASRVCWPTVVAALEQAPAADDAAEVDEVQAEFAQSFQDGGCSEMISMGMQEVLGWQSSYRRSAPEKKCFSAWRRRWSRQRLRWLHFPLHAPRTRRPAAEQLSRQEEWRLRKNRRRPS